MRAAAWLAACAALCLLRPCGAEYRVGDFVPTARRGQFHGVRACAARSAPVLTRLAPQSRTQWHDLLGRHCPKFGHTKTVRCWRLPRRPQQAADFGTLRPQVAVPLPRPVAFSPGDEYKLALAFDGDRFLTPWLPVLGKRAPEVPLLQVELVRWPRVRGRCAPAHAPTARADAHGGLHQRGARDVAGGACVVPAAARGTHPGAPRSRPVTAPAGSRTRRRSSATARTGRSTCWCTTAGSR